MMKYGVYLTIDGGDETILVDLYRMRRQAEKALDILSLDKDKIRMLAKGKNVTCLEVLDRRNMTTIKYAQIILEEII